MMIRPSIVEGVVLARAKNRSRMHVGTGSDLAHPRYCGRVTTGACGLMRWTRPRSSPGMPTLRFKRMCYLPW